MKTRRNTLLICLIILLSVAGCATTEQKASEKTPDQSSAQQPKINDYPTRDRVEYVLNCIAQHGGLTFVSQYACGCKIDKIAEKMSFSDYEAAKTFTLLKSTPGEAGGVFRDPKQSKDLRKQLKEAEAYAEKQCFVK